MNSRAMFTPAATGGPWTRHGHPIPGVTVAGHARPTAVARCGGPALCTQCALDVARATGSDEDSPAVAAPAVPAAVEVDARCTLGDCRVGGDGTYVMAGSCLNCRRGDIHVTFSRGHEKAPVDCPVCGCRRTVETRRLVTTQEDPDA